MAEKQPDSRERRDLLARLLGEQGIALPAERIVPRQSRAHVAPLSFAQKRLWFLHQLDPANAVYNIARALRLRGDLKCHALDRGLNEIVCRHEILRSVFACVDEEPVQQVAPELKIDLPLADLGALPRAQRSSGLRRVLAEEAGVPFDLERGPLLRARLIRLGKGDHVLLLILHQIICDGWSMNLLLGELAQQYRCRTSGKAARLPELRIQYGDYAAWQRKHLTNSALEGQIDYWRARLRNSSSGLALLTDYRRPAVQSFRGARLPFVVPPALFRGVKKLARETRATPFIALMTAFNVLLWRYTGQEDISVGFPVANRERRDLRSMIGIFVNTLVLRTDLSGRPTFRALLARVRRHCRAALAHQDLPFEKLVEELQREHDLSRNPLFQAMFAYQNYPAAACDFPGLRVAPVEFPAAQAKFDLALSLTQRGASLRGFIEYATDLFDESTIARMARHFLTLLRGIVTDPDRPIATLPLLTAAERRQIPVRWNRTGVSYPRHLCIHHLVEAQARRAPGAAAVECAGKQLTYGELNRRANRLARLLQRRGIGPEKIAGVCLERSLDMVIALLAILKSGGAYLPLDPSYPPERIAFMLRDARVSLFLTGAKFVSGSHPPSFKSVLPGEIAEVICMSDVLNSTAGKSSKNVPSNVQPRNLAYVIYTSGSTGQPKGVAIEHKNAVNFLHWARRAFTPAELAGVVASTSICFDLSIFELFAPLSCGGKVILVDDALAIADLREREDCTLINTVPAAMHELLSAGGLPRSVRTVNLAGEPLTPELVEQLYAAGSVDKVYDLYGPSETTTYSTFALRTAGSRATIGRPIANTRVYLLDATLQPVPIGVPGELFIGGAGVARGYLHRPELTAEKFVRSPFEKRAGARLYRTGDLARYRPDGNIEYLGRIDNQVKMRGYRIEPGEVETALAQHPAISECAVIANQSAPLTDDIPGNPKSQTCPFDRLSVGSERCIENPKSAMRLLAYFVSKPGFSPAAAELRDFLRAQLPEFMLPSAFVPIESLPKTLTGKVDRRALPTSGLGPGRGDEEFVAPRGEIEEIIVQIWRDVLKVERISVFDDFFDRGGHSLLATRVAMRLRAHCNMELPLRKLFESRTVAALARDIEALRRDRSGIALPPIVPGGRAAHPPLSFAQQRLWYLHKLAARLTAYNMPAPYRINGSLKIDKLERALNTMIRRHETLRTAIIEIDGEPAQQIGQDVQLSLPIVDLTASSPEQVETEIARYFEDDAGQPFDLAAAPLMRAKILRLRDDDHVLLLNFHHLICDGSSLPVFYRELAILYDSLCQGTDRVLPLPIQYTDFAEWQRRSLREGLFEPQLQYWKRQLGGALPPADLPADRPRPTVQTYRGAKANLRLPHDLTLAVKELARKEQVTLFMVLLAALDVLVARLTGRTDIVIGAAVAGRNRPELEGVIGFFINALALRTDLSGNPPFAELLRRVREICLDAYTNQDLPFEKVVEELQPDRDLSRNPLFQILFNMAEIAGRDLELPGCVVSRLNRVAPGAKFDLVAHAPEIDGCLELALVYNADLFTESRTRQILEQWRHLLSQIVANPAQRLDQLSLVTPAARALLPDPAESLDERWHESIQSWFSKRAEERPEKTAVADGLESWSYGELDRCANRLAHRLIARGIQPRQAVAVYGHRDASLALALLGILKAGAAFVILDPAYPAARLADYVRIAAPGALVQMEGAGALPRDVESGLHASQRVMLPRSKKNIARLIGKYSPVEPRVQIGPDDPAYLAFTSGSTGEPKGVLCRHGPITHFLPWQKEAFNLNEAERFALVSGLGYNHLHRDLFTALAVGATVCVPPAGDLRDPGRLVSWIDRNKISVLHLTPALGRFLQTAERKSLPSLRHIFFGGDLLLREDVLAMREVAADAELVSFYGATETQRAVGYFIVTEQILANEARPIIPTGRGVPDVQLVLMARSGQLAGIGEVGELYVRSPHLAAGYVDDRELTESHFITNPFTGDPRDRLYRTRELGRYLPDGDVEWLGRIGRRASIRGFRVELAEVENALRQCHGVRHAAVIAREVTTGATAAAETRLLACVEMAQGVPFDSNALRQALTTRLPHYMTPAYYREVDRMPLNPNGKIDYSALPLPEKIAARAGRGDEPPINDLERAVAAIFARVLQVDRIGRQDNFFALGGHSLLAAKAAAQIRERLGVQLDLRAFLECPTVEMICRRIEEDSDDGEVVASTQSQDREEVEI